VVLWLVDEFVDVDMMEDDEFDCVDNTNWAHEKIVLCKKTRRITRWDLPAMDEVLARKNPWIIV